MTRTNPPGAVFAQMLFSAMMSEADPRVVGLNFVAPEDNPTALADYALHMRMLDYLHGAMPQAVSLHAGELTLGLVPPDALRFHVRQAVEVAHARRIGHGVDVMYEADAANLLRDMAASGWRWRSTSPATTRSSACTAPRIRSRSTRRRRADGPVHRRRRRGRIDRTHELQRAVTEFGLDWPTLVGLERNTLEYAFVARRQPVGGSGGVAQGSGVRRPGLATARAGLCRVPAGQREGALQWALERDLAAFGPRAVTPMGFAPLNPSYSMAA